MDPRKGNNTLLNISPDSNSLPYGEKANLEEMSQGDGGVSETSEEEGKALENASKPSASQTQGPSPSNQSKADIDVNVKTSIEGDVDVKPSIKEMNGVPAPSKKSQIKLTVKEKPKANKPPIPSTETLNESAKPVKAGKPAAKVPCKKPCKKS
ncbi:hypothetical protein PCASD_24874 [Puccinia coronata f. sp. avenae]|uniref:Uncharacterized protein n=1 Tax=Puccinia coronata f. sp. avenae TaxID=200324 RepID=A0A2N5TWF7_9BASI|nr:hypothetical protein PCASD_24874 [Puccinia coronata f. sp. avenae]